MEKIIKPACYCRVSTSHQVDKESIPSQVHLLTNYCVGMLHVKKEDIEFYIDAGYSGKNTKRPEFERMVKDVKAGKRNMVLAFKLDRISRNLLDFARFMDELKAHNTDFVSLSESFDTSSVMGQGMLKLLMLFGEMERGITRERVLAVSKDIITRGGHLGAPTPLGYDYDKVTKVYSINEKEAETVRLMYRFAQEGKSTTYISNYLNDNHITSKRGGLWTSTTVGHILHNPAFKGQYVWNRNESGNRRKKDKSEWLSHEGVFPVIVDPRDWQSVQDMLKKRLKGRLSERSIRSHFFSNLLSCAECGRFLRYRSDIPRKDGTRPTVYHCPSHALHWGCSNGAYPSDLTLTPFILQYISNVHTLTYMTDSISTSAQLAEILLRNMPANCRLSNLSTLYGLFTRANMEPIPGNVAMIKTAALRDQLKKDASLAKYYKALDRLKDLYLYGDSDLSKEEYLAERKKIEAKIASMAEVTTDSEKQTSPALLVDRKKYGPILERLTVAPNYKLIAKECGHDLLSQFFHDCLEGVTVHEKQVVRITFKNGISHNFEYL